MTQTVTGPDGVEHEFPDGTPDDVIKKVMRQNYGAPTQSSSSALDSAPPSMTQRVLNSLSQVGRNADDDVRLFGKGWTMGLGDRLGGPDAVRATNDAATRQGWLGVIPETLGMVTNPVADVVGAYKAGKLVKAASEGAIQSGVQSYSAGNSPGQIALDALKGSGASAALQPVADVAGKVAQKLGVLVKNNIPTASDVEGKISDLWNSINSARYAPKDVQATARASQSAAASDPSPLTEITNPKAWKLHDDFSDYSGDPTSMNSVRELRGWRDKANALTGDDARFGQNLSDQIDDLLTSKNPTIVPKGMLARDVSRTASQANDYQALLEQYNQSLAASPTNITGKAADIIGAHSWGTAHHVGMPIAQSILAGTEGYHMAGVPGAIGSVGATLAVQPAINAGMKSISDAAKDAATTRAMQAAIEKYPSMGAPTIDHANALRRLLFGEYQYNQ